MLLAFCELSTPPSAAAAAIVVHHGTHVRGDCSPFLCARASRARSSPPRVVPRFARGASRVRRRALAREGGFSHQACCRACCSPSVEVIERKQVLSPGEARAAGAGGTRRARTRTGVLCAPAVWCVWLRRCGGWLSVLLRGVCVLGLARGAGAAAAVGRGARCVRREDGFARWGCCRTDCSFRIAGSPEAGKTRSPLQAMADGAIREGWGRRFLASCVPACHAECGCRLVGVVGARFFVACACICVSSRRCSRCRFRAWEAAALTEGGRVCSLGFFRASCSPGKAVRLKSEQIRSPFSLQTEMTRARRGQTGRADAAWLASPCATC